MSEVGPGGGAARRNAAARRMADGLYFAAAPTFATMALLTAVLGGSADGLCSAAGAVPFGGMLPMYMLMSVFHSVPWLKLIARRRSAVGSVLRLAHRAHSASAS